MRVRTWMAWIAAPMALAACDNTPMETPDAYVSTSDSGMADAMVDGGATDAGPRPDGGGEVIVPPTYEFESRFTPGTSSVSHSGQTARHVLIADLSAYIGSLTGAIDSGSVDPTTGAVAATLVYYLEDSAAERAADPIRLSTGTTTPVLQTTYGELSTTAFLLEKVAGNDAVTDHRDWSTEFRGWSDASVFRGTPDVSTPTALTRSLFATIDANAIDHGNGIARLDPLGAELPVHVTAEGIDLQQLTQKLLLMALTFSQGADDYLDDEAEDTTKGLLSPNTRDGTSAYTTLEHAWDEGWGYFGGAADYGMTPLDTLTGSTPFRDTSMDGRISLFTEYNFGASTNAAKRDSGSAASARTMYVMQADTAFRRGRAIIAAAGETLTAEELTALRAERDAALAAWEAALAATVVHYINDVLRDMGAFGTAEYVFVDHAKHWSELKGFALGFQFNRRSPMLEDDAGMERFVRFHALIGDRPVLSTADAGDITAYRAALVSARDILQTAYSFDAANMGDADGVGGW